MVRYWAIALVALIPAIGSVTNAGGGKGDKDLRFEGKLTKDDPKDRKQKSAFKVHLVRMKKGISYTIDMKSTKFDNYLRLEDMKGKELAEDDDSGGMQNAQIVFNCPMDGQYKVICTAFNENGVGDYVLTVKITGKAAVITSPHALLMGKPAPDFQSDFALNGKPVKLSDLKGKVVLLDFWEVRNLPSVSGLPKLIEWNKAHKQAGLEVVGVTFYHYENGQFIGFDKENNKLTKIDQGNQETERAMLKDFAEYHKIDYLLTVLHKQDALKTFNEYLVNGLPQVVLIDRQGKVRLSLPGDRVKYGDAIEKEIKKLLAEP